MRRISILTENKGRKKNSFLVYVMNTRIFIWLHAVILCVDIIGNRDAYSTGSSRFVLSFAFDQLGVMGIGLHPDI